MRIGLVILIALSVLLAGCSSGTATHETPPASPPLASSSTSSTDFGPPADDGSLDRRDAAGRTPDEALLALIDAKNAGDSQAEYSAYATPEVDFTTASQEWKDADEHYADFTIRESRVTDAETAWLRVTYEASTTPPGGTRYPVVVGEPGEWWPLHKVGGLWKVQWLPRQ